MVLLVRNRCGVGQLHCTGCRSTFVRSLWALAGTGAPVISDELNGSGEIQTQVVTLHEQMQELLASSMLCFRLLEIRRCMPAELVLCCPSGCHPAQLWHTHVQGPAGPLPAAFFCACTLAVRRMPAQLPGLPAATAVDVVAVLQGTHGFTLDPLLGEFMLTHPNITIPKRGQMYSVNDARYFDCECAACPALLSVLTATAATCCLQLTDT
jgi:hypothetical protein